MVPEYSPLDERHSDIENDPVVGVDDLNACPANLSGAAVDGDLQTYCPLSGTSSFILAPYLICLKTNNLRLAQIGIPVWCAGENDDLSLLARLGQCRPHEPQAIGVGVSQSVVQDDRDRFFR